MMNNVLLKFAVAGCIVFSACNECDDEVAAQIDNKYISGVYQLESYNVPQASDFNNDGHSSTNLANEQSCLADARLTINDDFTYSHSHFEMGTSGDDITCSEVNNSGIWERTGFTLTTTDQNGAQTNYDFDAGDETITHHKMAQYPYQINGEVINGNGQISIVYKRQ